MTRTHGASDLEAALEFARLEPPLTIWFVADLESFGLGTDFLELWGDFRDGRLRAMLLRYYGHCVAYSRDGPLPAGLAGVLRDARPP